MTLLLAAALVGLDQLTKALVVNNLALGESIPLALGFSITHSRNTGAAFGMLRDFNLPIGSLVVDGTFLLGVLSAAVSLVLAIYLLRNARRLPALMATALGLVLAGAAGNMIDRFRLGYVVDFIHFNVGTFHFPVFNVADSCVVIGAALLVIASLRDGSTAPASAAGGARTEADARTEPPVKRGPAPREHALEEMPEVSPLTRRGPEGPG